MKVSWWKFFELNQKSGKAPWRSEPMGSQDLKGGGGGLSAHVWFQGFLS